MPTTYLTDKQLLEWYERFKKELRTKANIDVTRIEDLGRIKNYPIIGWGDINNDEERESAIIGEPTYAYMPHEGNVCLARSPVGVSYEEHKEWVRSNLKTEIDINHIRILCEMSQDGTLMIREPGKGEDYMRQVFTDPSGNIITSKPWTECATSKYTDQKLRKEIANWAGMPKFVPEPDPTKYGLPAKPVAPKIPEGEEPGFWSWLGALFGINTNYRKIERYEKDLAKWNELVESDKGFDYRAARLDKETYEVSMAQYRLRPEAILQGISAGFQAYCHERTGIEDDYRFEQDKIYRNVMVKEVADLEQDHYKTPLGKLTKGLEDLKALEKGSSKRTTKTVSALLSFLPSPDAHKEWIRDKKVFKSNEYRPKSGDGIYKLPPNPFAVPGKSLHDYTPEEVAKGQGWRNEVNTLSGLAGLCALGYPDVIGEPAEQNYTDILKALFTVGIENSQDKLAFLDPARDRGLEAIHEYYKGNEGKLIELFSNGLRRLNREVRAQTNLHDEHAVNTLCLIDHMMNTLEKHEGLIDKLDLSAQDKKQIAANRALYRVMYQSRVSRVTMMEYALSKKDLTPEELEQAATDLRFADAIADAFSKGVEVDLTNPENVKAAKQAFAEECGIKNIHTIEREELARKVLSTSDFIKQFPAKMENVFTRLQNVKNEPNKELQNDMGGIAIQ